MRLISKVLLAVVLLFLYQETTAQGIRGNVVSENGDPLAFASVYVRNISNGIPTNPEGYFEMELDPGRYEILVQHLGYQAVQQTVEVQEGWKDLNVTLELQTYSLQEVEVKSRQEDPALTIMRRAIAKAKYHRLQVQEY